jgi:hypothetical protein
MALDMPSNGPGSQRISNQEGRHDEEAKPADEGLDEYAGV